MSGCPLVSYPPSHPSVVKHNRVQSIIGTGKCLVCRPLRHQHRSPVVFHGRPSGGVVLAYMDTLRGRRKAMGGTTRGIRWQWSEVLFGAAWDSVSEIRRRLIRHRLVTPTSSIPPRQLAACITVVCDQRECVVLEMPGAPSSCRKKKKTRLVDNAASSMAHGGLDDMSGVNWPTKPT